ncbi:ArsR/SmtB family transcription factor [Testudinibacter sp. TR-2022]|uniref:ArsR/SmtB family transcription factor n=1 Tax=Testudinibacter sp. TR-2022 TaxID=2585029 RepID=UPI00111B0C1F|nr:metalloregulator ArsR/SmtB family transcription factor [Testudinibacter sp. TR-2022]TNH06764.1 helix-turn-helix transcriptional regulator [Pasteurellaceae bacterium Phil11]TNH22519.1 helix-turn-helix transcriptional regulator [Testudinibacter sp. TR-2022]TNH28265.1 helix-turn-helix transcriptional regulator [Testudinibacter sp. TR-2022]
MDLIELKQSAEQAKAFLQALANQDRLLLLCALTQQEYTVGELEQQLGILQPTLSQQLTVLRNEGLVDVRKEGRYHYYRVSDERVKAVLGLLYQFFCQKEK